MSSKEEPTEPMNNRPWKNLPFIDDEEPFDSTGGCRPCCSCPHGVKGILSVILATVAFGLGMPAVGDCHFMTPNYLYCHPAPEKPAPYGTCGDCHCINGDQPCPSNPNEIPLVNVPNDWLRQLKDVKAINPIKMLCNPYNQTGDGYNCTDPPMKGYQVELWETAACGHKYDLTSLTPDQCPTQYFQQTYDSKEALEADGAEMTHWGACGACSTARDFAVYLEYPDLTGKGQECGVRFLASGFAESVKCFQEVGYTYDCAVMWTHNVQNTRDKCFNECIDFTFFSDGFNNGPPPECKIANCLLCDEQMSGPYFQTFAARSRRRSGLLSKIVRDCENILIVDHQPPCNVTRAAAKRQLQGTNAATKITAPPKFTPPEETETCVFITDDLGLRGYEQEQTNEFLIPKAFLETTEREMISRYEGCRFYEFDSALGGFWKLQREIFGASYNFALTMGMIANILGGICVTLLWITSCCVATRSSFWKVMAYLFGLIGLCMLLTLTFFASDVCAQGCTIGRSAGYAIASGILWWFTAIITYHADPADKSIPKASCCCCPTLVNANNVAYSAVPSSEEEKDEGLEQQVVSDAT